MILKSCLITLLFACTSLAYAQNTLEVEITNLRNDKGLVSIELLDEDKKNVVSKTELIKNKKCVVTFKGLKDNKYAVRYFHDENSNNKVDKNRIGIPKEGYGFSNDAYGNFGPKKFKKWLFTVKGYTRIKLRTEYF